MADTRARGGQPGPPPAGNGRGGGSRKRAGRKTAGQSGAAQDGAVQDGAVQDGAVQDGPAQDGVGHDAAGQDMIDLTGAGQPTVGMGAASRPARGYAGADALIGASVGRGPSAPRRHDPRIDPPTKEDRRRLWRWVALLAFCPICLGVVVWAALGMNGNYPTVKPPVPAGWQSVPGIYASFSVPGNWSLKDFMSDVAGDTYYSGPGGGVGESVTQAGRAPDAYRHPPEIVGTFLGYKYQVSSVTPTKVANATVAWDYRFHLANGTTAMGVLAWVRPTQSDVWLVATPDSATTRKAITTLALAS